ncbi:LysR family transcriptional regulator [Paenibacillus xanthanilyticus]|uniref:helix-turn-helix domain-containing protein n=1 Tax=Paenibacillus xanthanilyticus TaxID=1783531 RepID=UPI0036452C19
MESGDFAHLSGRSKRKGSVTNAARTLGYVQSNITARIRHLEIVTGHHVVHPAQPGHGLVGQPQAAAALRYKIVGLLDEARSALSASDDPAARCGSGPTQTAARVRLPSLTNRLLFAATV